MDIEALIPKDKHGAPDQSLSEAEAKLKYTTALCSSVQMCLTLSENSADACYPCEMNPARLICTCKGFRGFSICSHVIAATALFVPNEYTAQYVEDLLEVIKSKRGANRDTVLTLEHC